MTRELRSQDELLLPRDTAPILYVRAQQWACPLCDPEDSAPVPECTVVWLGTNTLGPHGRCSSCGQKYALAHAGDHAENVPSIAAQLEDQAR